MEVNPTLEMIKGRYTFQMDKRSTNEIPVSELISYLTLARTENIGAIRYRQLLNTYKNPEQALRALSSLNLKKDRSKKFNIPTTASILREIENTFNANAQFILYGFDDYPKLLSHIYDPPPILTVLGNKQYLDKKNIAIVGARNASLHGVQIAQNLATELSSYGIGITSGLARGIDQAAHKGALYTGFTIAAIACGINIAYPHEHTKLQNKIAEQGVVVTEFPFGAQPQATHFPRRNRLIAGLCHGCVVIEAALNSGSLITSKLALDYHKPIFAVPGSPLDPRCKGSNNLIRSGAILTEEALDVLSEIPEFSLNNSFLNSQKLALQNKTKPSKDLFSASSKQILNKDTHHLSIEDYILSLLSTTPVSIDTILRNAPFPASKILSCMTLLEINSKILYQQNGYVLKFI